MPIHPDDYKATGLAWCYEGDNSDTFLFDAWQPFGSVCGPSHFSHLSDTIRWIIHRKGYKEVINYIDDFLLACSTYEECKKASPLFDSPHQKTRIARELDKGNWSYPACNILRCGHWYCGVYTVARAWKTAKLHGILKTFKAKWRATKVLLQSLAGSLNWACQVVRGGCFFLWCIVDIIKPLLQAGYKTMLNDQFQEHVDRCMQSGQWVLLGWRLALRHLSCRLATSSTDAY